MGSVDQFADVGRGITLCYRDEGPQDAPAVLLIGGLGEDLTSWTRAYIDPLQDAGLRVVRPDNRDSGRSTFVSTPPPALWRQIASRPRSEAYTLGDMAADVIGLVNHLRLDRVHVIGRSMGGMIAQTLTARHPERVASLTSVYSTTGAPKIGQPAASTLALLAAPAPKDRVGAVIQHLRMTHHLAGTAYPIDETAEAALAVEAWDRRAGNAADGSARQIEAIAASGDRTAELRRIQAPTLVLHGDRDRIVNPSGGQATAAAIPGARHRTLVGQGHHLPDAASGVFFAHVIPHVRATTPTPQEIS